MASRLALALVALASACAMSPQNAAPLVGIFGGEHIRMTVGSVDSDVEYDCAAGTLLGPLPVRGDFTNAGSHTPGIGGPERVGETRPAYPATYRGRVLPDSIEMIVDVDLPSGQARLGPFRLRQGSDGNLLRCL